MTGHRFDDSDAYEQFMGRWSRALGQRFVCWMGPPTAARWLDVGCGTGISTQLVLDTCSPAAVSAVDPAKAQIEGAWQVARRGIVEFRVADAQALPFADASFDVVASTLVINFIPDRPRALSEMCRVARSGGLVAGCVWDFAAELSPSWPLRRAMRRIGVDVPPVPGADDSSLDALAHLFSAAGLQRIAMTSVEVVVPFLSFDELWRSLTVCYAPTTKLIDAMPPSDRLKLIHGLRAELLALPDGSISYSARANAIKGYVRGCPA